MPDFNDAPKQRGLDLIPAGTVVCVQMTIRPGGHGPEGLFKLSGTGAEMLDTELTVVTPGQFERRKMWQNIIVAGPSKGHAEAAEISRGMIRAMLESARNIKPDDASPEATKARSAEYSDLQDLRFVIKVGIERDKTGQYDDKNRILAIVTPESKQYTKPEQIPQQQKLPGIVQPAAAKPASAPAKIARPVWSNAKSKEDKGPEAAE
jgi:hypothetical protein